MADMTELLLGAKTVVGGVGDGTSRMKDDLGSFLFLPEQVVDFTAINGNAYRIDLGVRLGEGGEGAIFDAEDPEGHKFVAKVYPVPKDRREWEDHKRVLEFLGEYTRGGLARCKSTHLMPLFAYGTMLVESREYVVLILPYCECLGDVPVEPSVLKAQIIPAVATALKFLHDRSFIHRDVKPSNIFEYDGVVVLGDFGISTIFREGEENRQTMQMRGTLGYFPGTIVVNPQRDWYALGYTIWTMYDENVHPHQQLIDTGSMADVWAGKRPVPFLPKSQADEGLRELVYGLVDEHADRRFGYDEVMRWRRDPVSFASWCASRRTIEDGGTGWGTPYLFDGVRCTDGLQLARELAGKWEFALRHLFDGEALVNHFQRVGDTDTYTNLRTIVRNEASQHQDRGLAKAIYFISGEDQLLAWRGSLISLEGVSQDFRTKGPSLTRYDDVFKEGLLSWYLEQAGGTPNSILRVLRYVERLSQGRSRLARLVYLHCFVDGEGTGYAGTRNADELAQLVIGQPGSIDPSLLYGRAAVAQSREELIAALAPHLAKRGMLEEVGRIADEFGPQVANDGKQLLGFVDKYLLTLDALSDGCAAARAFAATYGPSAPWFWVGRNAKSYAVEQRRPHADEAAEALRGVARCVPSDGASVADIQRQGAAALKHCDVIRSLMDVSPMALYAGVRTEKPVTARCDDALFCSSFFGQIVPRGFVRMFPQASSSKDTSIAQLLFGKGDTAGQAMARNVRLLAPEVRGNTDYLTFAHARCDEVLDAARQLEASVSKRDAIRSILASIVGILMLLGGLNLFLLSVGLDLSHLKDARTVGDAILIGPSLPGVLFLILDGIRVLRTLRGPATADSVSKRVRQLSASLDEQDRAFRNREGAQSSPVQSLCDVKQNQQHRSTAFSSALETQMGRVGASSSPAGFRPRKVFWHITVILASLLMLLYGYGYAYAMEEYGGVLFSILFLFIWLPGCIAPYLYVNWRLSALDEEIYCAYGWVLTILTVFVTGLFVIWYFLALVYPFLSFFF